MWNPFTIDNDEDKMDLSRALLRVQDELDQLHLENDMTAIKKRATKAPKAQKEAAPKAQKEAAERHPRATPEGFVGLTELAAEMGIKPAALRRKLRGLENIVKPEGQHGWYWKNDSRDLASVRRALAAKAE